MNRRGCVISAAITVVVMFAMPVGFGAQSADPTGPSPKTRTTWGHPDLQGIWTSSTYTPLERPDHLSDRGSKGPLYEYACHEGDYDIRHILEVARNLDKAEAGR